MANLVTKYKERSPEETIKIIHSFFESAGYDISLYNLTHSEAGTYSCSVSIHKDNIFYLVAHGKGISESYCKASAYAELYERFCNKCESNRNPFVIKDIQQKCYEKYGYYINKNEKSLSYEEIMSVPCISQFLKYHWQNDALIKNYLTLVLGQNILGEPFIDLTNVNNTPYYNQALLNIVVSSVGMCAGNTIEEALNQGLSEICEHIVEEQFLSYPQDYYYIIDPSCLNAELQHTINNIEQSGSKLFIFDLSYNFKMPVVMSLLINQKHKVTNINFGSFPIFDIAVERIITELYQGIESFNDFPPEQMQIPYHQAGSLPDGRNTLTEFSYFNEDILLTKHKIVTHSSDIFIQNNNYTNYDLNNYFINLFKSFDYSIHYVNNSLCNDMYALSIIIPEYHYGKSFFIQNEFINANNSIEILQYNLLTLMKIHKFMNQIIHTNISDYEFAERAQDIYNRCCSPWHNGSLCGTFMFSDWLNPVPQRVGEILWCYNNGFYTIPQNSLSIFYPIIKIYATLQQYKNNNYTLEKIQAIFKVMFNIDITEEDYLYCSNTEYLTKKIHLETIYKYRNSAGYQSFLEDNIKKE